MQPASALLLLAFLAMAGAFLFVIVASAITAYESFVRIEVGSLALYAVVLGGLVVALIFITRKLKPA